MKTDPQADVEDPAAEPAEDLGAQVADVHGWEVLSAPRDGSLDDALRPW